MSISGLLLHYREDFPFLICPIFYKYNYEVALEH